MLCIAIEHKSSWEIKLFYYLCKILFIIFLLKSFMIKGLEFYLDTTSVNIKVKPLIKQRSVFCEFLMRQRKSLHICNTSVYNMETLYVIYNIQITCIQCLTLLNQKRFWEIINSFIKVWPGSWHIPQIQNGYFLLHDKKIMGTLTRSG